MIRQARRSTLFPYTSLFRSRTQSFSRGTTTPKVHTKQLWCTLRSEEHTSELQSRPHLVCRLLLEKTKTPHTSFSQKPLQQARLHTHRSERLLHSGLIPMLLS